MHNHQKVPKLSKWFTLATTGPPVCSNSFGAWDSQLVADVASRASQAFASAHLSSLTSSNLASSLGHTQQESFEISANS
eukprot:351539-Amphidinium_carterae.1